MPRTPAQTKQYNVNKQIAKYRKSEAVVKESMQHSPMTSSINFDDVSLIDIENTIAILKKMRTVKKQRLKLEAQGVVIDTPEPEVEPEPVVEPEPEPEVESDSELEPSKKHVKKPSKKKPKKKSESTSQQLTVPQKVLKSCDRRLVHQYMRKFNKVLQFDKDTASIDRSDYGKIKLFARIRDEAMADLHYIEAQFY